MGDSSNTPALEWQILSGPSTPIWSSHTSLKPTLTGIVFGNYRVQLVATNSNGGSGISIQDIGAVAYDDNGVVIPADPRATQIFGPQIAFGQNPWGYEDERNLKAIQLQIANNPYYASATWLTTGQGTVSYPFAGIGPSPGQPGTTLSAGITATATSIPVADASKLPSLTSLPTAIIIGGGYSRGEVIRICSTTATSGAATLTVCYDGRGIASTSNGNQSSLAAQSWTSGAPVGEYRIQGTGTLFATDSQRPLCPAGVPGPMGKIAYTTGSVQLSTSSAIVTGIGTTWNTTGAWTGYNIQISATHGGGTAFKIWGVINAVGSTTSITMNRPAPADVDTMTNFSYAILSPIYLSLEFSDSNNTYRAIQNGVYCESETAAFGIGAHDIPAFDGTTQTGLKYSYKLALGAASAFGPNFYGTGLAAREFYYRSGWAPALALANQIDENWTRDPELCGGLCGGLPLLYGGGAIGGVVDKALNESTVLSWYDVKGWGDIGLAYSTHSCNADDQRDSSYPLALNALLGVFDPDPTRHTAWLNGLTTWSSREDSCRRKASDGYTGVAVNSWASAFLFNNGGPALTLTNGSTAVTPTVAHSLTSDMCGGLDDGTGTITVTNGSGTAAVASGSVASGGLRIWITNTSVSPAYVVALAYSGSGGAGSTITLGGLWPGTNGTFRFMVEGTSTWGNGSAIGVDNSDSLSTNLILQETWVCRFTDSDHIVLNRPWDNASGNNWHMSTYNVIGFETQPFMLGIKRTAMNWASEVSDATISANFSTLLPYIGNWMNTYGTDNAGSPYARVTQVCEPRLTPTPGTTFLTTHGGGDGNCGLNGLFYLPSSEANDRAHNAEAGTAMLSYYLAAPNSTTRANVDTFYGQIFGYCPYTQGGGSTYYCDANYVNTSGELSDGSLGAYKWTGFFFGVGGLFANSWPATRVGGVPPALPQTLSVTCNISSVSNATKCRVTITKPDGSTATNTCTTSPCPVTADGRQGDHLLKVDYLSASDMVLTSGEPVPVRVN